MSEFKLLSDYPLLAHNTFGFDVRAKYAVRLTEEAQIPALAAAGYLVVLQCELQLGYSATAAGAALIPESAVFLIVSPLVTWLWVGAIIAALGGLLALWPLPPPRRICGPCSSCCRSACC